MGGPLSLRALSLTATAVVVFARVSTASAEVEDIGRPGAPILNDHVVEVPDSLDQTGAHDEARSTQFGYDLEIDYSLKQFDASQIPATVIDSGRIDSIISGEFLNDDTAGFPIGSFGYQFVSVQWPSRFDTPTKPLSPEAQILRTGDAGCSGGGTSSN